VQPPEQRQVALLVGVGERGNIARAFGVRVLAEHDDGDVGAHGIFPAGA